MTFVEDESYIYYVNEYTGLLERKSVKRPVKIDFKPIEYVEVPKIDFDKLKLKPLRAEDIPPLSPYSREHLWNYNPPEEIERQALYERIQSFPRDERVSFAKASTLDFGLFEDLETARSFLNYSSDAPPDIVANDFIETQKLRKRF